MAPHQDRPISVPKHSGRTQQSGQAIVLVLLLTMIGVLGAIALVSTGTLTSEKIQLQNAADATAYSVSTIEARDLNYTAYMNRAMVANEVAIGQMVSMMSWAYMTRSTPEFIDDYAFKIDIVVAAATLGIATSSVSNAVRPITAPLRTVSNAVFRVVDKFTGPVANGLSVMNKMYSYSQQGVHLASFIFSASTLFDIRDMNADDAEYSMFGAIAIARHFTSYYGDMLSPKLYSFVNSYSPGSSEEELGGMQRLASVINDSRDGFTRNRECSLQLGGQALPTINLGILRVTFTPPGVNCRPNQFNNQSGGWDATLFGIKVEIDVFLLVADFYVRAGIGRQGGTDLRHNSKGEFTWSAADSTDPRVALGGGFKLCIGIPFIGRVCSPRAGFDFDPPLPPFGVGAAMAGGSSPNMSGIKDEGEARDIMYGSASRNVLAWSFVMPPFKPTPPAIKYIKSVKQQVKSKDRNIYKSYGLRSYKDTEDVPAIATTANPDSGDWMTGMEAPYLVIALIKDDVVKDSHNSKGRFDLDTPENGLLGTDIPFGVMSKSEVYYSRPADLQYFSRPDNRVEKSNAFNPYWEARLVDTSYIDRVSALAFQHGQIPLPSSVYTVIAQAEKLLNALI